MQTQSRTISVRSPLPFDRCVCLLSGHLQQSGLEIISELAVHRRLKRELGLGLPRCTIFTVWDPVVAFQALTAETEAGCLTLFNVTVAERGPQSVVCAPRPSALASESDPIGTRLMALAMGEKTMKALAQVSGAALPLPTPQESHHTASWLGRSLRHVKRMVFGGLSR